MPPLRSAHSCKEPEFLAVFGGNFAKQGEIAFAYPCAVLRADGPDDLPKALESLDQAVRSGHWVAAVFSYELGYVLEPRLLPLLPQRRKVPLIWASVFDSPLPHIDTRDTPVVSPPEFAAAVGADTYTQHIETILDLIRAGDVYQVNYTYPMTADWDGDPTALYRALLALQPVPYPAMINMGELTVLSLSPELFFRIDGSRITLRPMKGTARRARSLEADTLAAQALSASGKDKAENLMIVDLLRNDVSRTAIPGSVRVSDLYRVETYRTLHTLTSGIEAQLEPDWTPSALLKAVFPCGSVTGAPKIRAMEIISVLEAAPRGVYTGAIGLFSPNGSACLNVAIRTLTLSSSGVLSLGVGGGIVSDSDPQAEAAETQLKARFATELPHRAADQAPLKLIETLAWDPKTGFALLSEHLARLENSAAYFRYPFNHHRTLSALNASLASWGGTPARVRLTLDQEGELVVTCAPLPPTHTLWHYVLSERRIDSTDPYRAHKTTRRGLYDEERERALAKGAHEVLFLNERGEVTEGAITNIFIQINCDPKFITPPVASGALPGTLRARMIAEGKVREAPILPDDLDTASRVWVGNGIRGLIPTVPLPPKVFSSTE